MESEVDSRLVSHQDGKWRSAGPFESYDHLGETNWVIVGANGEPLAWPTAALMRPFRELPDWRIDDLMISFLYRAAASVHLDQYDVFIIQGTGRRRWRVGEKLQMKQHCPHRTCYRSIRSKPSSMKSWSWRYSLYSADSRMKATRWKMR